jgi:mannan endo-1,4-beta-mannosidase
MAVKEGTKEYEATVADIRMMAGLLRPFAVKDIPILWRPLHEGEGDWFWWGVSGSEPLKKLYRLMYDIFVNEYHLDNLIWVWNSPRKEDYPGDDVVDVISRDMYPPAHVHTSQAQHYNDLIKITEADKPVIIAETGTLPDAKAIHDEKIGWSSYMTWSHGFCIGNEFNDEEELKKMYNSPYAITLENLPKLY